MSYNVNPLTGIPEADLSPSVQYKINSSFKKLENGAGVGGSTTPYTRTTMPSDQGFAAWSYDPTYIANGTTATTGKVVAVRVWMPTTKTITRVGIVTRAGGTGATPLANGYVALFSKTGQRLGVSADVGNTTSGNWGDGVNGLKATAVTADSTGSLTVTGGPNEYVYAAYLLGTNSTTALTIGSNAQQNVVVSNVGLLTAAGTAFTFALATQAWLYGTGLTSIPTSVDLTAGASTPILPGANFWFGLYDN